MRVVAVLLVLTACEGAEATDAEVCRDVVRRLCSSRCEAADAKLGLTIDSNCTAQLTAASGCGSDDFKFESRSAFLSCRLPIIRAGDNVDQVPSCDDVDDMLRGCPSLVQFYGGR
ncbi:MAG: hypothetical protein JNK82_18085 [Myxococcaceae bacterium]|nr:hypothetical protein [Myxococcaceae bacterium]